MKPIKLNKADDVSFIEVGLVLRDFAEELAFPKELTHDKNDGHRYTVELNADIFEVEIHNQETQVKVNIRKVKTIDDVINDVERELKNG